MESEVLDRIQKMTLTTDEDEVMHANPLSEEGKGIGRILLKPPRKVPHNEANQYTSS